MAKKEKINIDNTGVDKLETFLQHNIKLIVAVITAVLVIFIASYLIYTAKSISTNNKLDQISAAEMNILDNATVDSYLALSDTVPALKDYIELRGASIYYIFNNDAAAIKALKNVHGKYEELGAGMLFDLGDDSINPALYLSGSMSELWYYRNVLSSTSENIEINLNKFKTAYPESPLLQLVENWNVN